MLSDSTNGGAQFSCRVPREEQASGVLLELVGELDVPSAPVVGPGLGAVAAERPGLVVGDLAGLMFMGSVGRHVLLEADARQRETGVRLSIVRGGPQPACLSDRTGTATHLPLVDRVPACSRAVTGRREPVVSWRGTS